MTVESASRTHQILAWCVVTAAVSIIFVGIYVLASQAWHGISDLNRAKQQTEDLQLRAATAQEHYQSMILELTGGVATVPRTPTDVDAALQNVVDRLEALGGETVIDPPTPSDDLGGTLTSAVTVRLPTTQIDGVMSAFEAAGARVTRFDLSAADGQSETLTIRASLRFFLLTGGE